ncbi:MAG: ribulose-phosphate 3-epimerase [Treponema sp.]|jgi:ribulose-phosphate 3-epimerase|nr:ribulose-phosphate 3-epimerase [Treponema sp.]
MMNSGPGKPPDIYPSIICADWNDPAMMDRLRSLGIRCLHVDIIDGIFSPDIPLSLSDLPHIIGKQKNADIGLDFHIMSMDNEKFVRQALEFEPYQVCFHIETCLHTDRLLRIIRAAGVRCGVALNPATPVSMLEYAAEICDYVLLMLINPGFAKDRNESMVPYAYKKIQDCRRLLDKTGRHIDIELDGRVSFDNTAALIKAGGDILVAGSSSLFLAGSALEDNFRRFKAVINE